MSEKLTLDERINGYLMGGGLFNPEMADHQAVRDLIIDCRDALKRQTPYIDRGDAVNLATNVLCDDDVNITEKGIFVLAATVLRMDAYITAVSSGSHCDVPPPGWFCTRTHGHEGPCAAWPVSGEQA